MKDKISDVLDELDLTEYDDYEPPRQDADVDDEDEDWLLDSELNYIEQMKRYKNWRNKTD